MWRFVSSKEKCLLDFGRTAPSDNYFSIHPSHTSISGTKSVSIEYGSRRPGVVIKAFIWRR